MLMTDHISERLSEILAQSHIMGCGGMALINGGLEIITIEDSNLGMHMSKKMFFVHISCLSWHGGFGVSIIMIGLRSIILEELYS